MDIPMAQIGEILKKMKSIDPIGDVNYSERTVVTNPTRNVLYLELNHQDEQLFLHLEFDTELEQYYYNVFYSNPNPTTTKLGQFNTSGKTKWYNVFVAVDEVLRKMVDEMESAEIQVMVHKWLRILESPI